MSNNKQSSVEWLIEQYKKCFGPVIPLIMNNENEKAKAMHKEEIINAVGSCGYIGWWRYRRGSGGILQRNIRR
jgi:hypothetical protein